MGPHSLYYSNGEITPTTSITFTCIGFYVLCFQIHYLILILIQPDEASNYCFTIRNVRFREFKWFDTVAHSYSEIELQDLCFFHYSKGSVPTSGIHSLPLTSACQNVSSSCSHLCPYSIHFLRYRSYLSFQPNAPKSVDHLSLQLLHSWHLTFCLKISLSFFTMC